MNSVQILVFGDRKDLAQIPFSLRCVQYMVTGCCMRTMIHVQCEMFAHGHGSVIDEEEPSRCVV